MDFTVVADSVTTALAAQTLGSAAFGRHDFATLVDQSPSCVKALQISALISPFDAVAPPPVRPNSIKTAPRTVLRRKRRTRRRSSTGGGSQDGDDAGYFGDFGGDGPFGGGGGCGSSGGGWNFGGNGDQHGDESSYNSSDSASNFIREVVGWIALSNCVHFAFKKVFRIVTDGVSDSREKVSMTTMC